MADAIGIYGGCRDYREMVRYPQIPPLVTSMVTAMYGLDSNGTHGDRSAAIKHGISWHTHPHAPHTQLARRL